MQLRRGKIFVLNNGETMYWAASNASPSAMSRLWPYLVLNPALFYQKVWLSFPRDAKHEIFGTCPIVKQPNSA